MTIEERQELATMADKLTIYRGDKSPEYEKVSRGALAAKGDLVWGTA